MCRRFDFDNTISLIGAWFCLVSTLGLYYLIRGFVEWRHDCKYSFYKPFYRTLFEMLDELKPSYWWSC